VIHNDIKPANMLVDCGDTLRSVLQLVQRRGPPKFLGGWPLAPPPSAQRGARQSENPARMSSLDWRGHLPRVCDLGNAVINRPGWRGVWTPSWIMQRGGVQEMTLWCPRFAFSDMDCSVVVVGFVGGVSAST
jgi:serine/threonine protein kinase